MPVVIPPPALRPDLMSSGRWQAILSVPELRQLIHKANDKYFCWEDLRHRMPPDVQATPEEVWACIKMIRGGQVKLAPFLDKDGRPFSYWIPDSLHRAISEMDRWSGGLLTSDQPSLHTRERYIINSLMDEAIASSQLEGASTEYRVAKEMLREGRKPKDKNERMILNNWEAMQHIREHVKDPMTVESLCELHAILTRGTLERPEDAGRFRSRDDISVVYLDEVVHEPPKSASLAKRMEKLCGYFNADDERQWVHPLIKATQLHFWLGYDHPFVDGNGRTARMLMYWYLLSRDYALFQYLSISRHFLRSPGQYVRAYVHSETDDNDLTYFLAYNVRVVAFALRDLREYIGRKQGEVAKASAMLRTFRGLNARQKTLIYHAIQHPEHVYTIEGHKNTQGTVYETARRDLLALVSKGFLRKERDQGKQFIFLPSERMLERLRAGKP